MEAAVTTPEQQQRWERARDSGRLTDDAFGDPEFVDTVGAVALDAGGNLTACSSTGGVFGKLPGRVGDAAILGAGLFASRRAAVVGTGVGELFLRSLAALRVALLIEQGSEPQVACRSIIESVARTDPRPIGLLALDAEGRIGAAYSGAALQIEGLDGAVEAERL
jgi:beta-aspartyl-peptidase (threonine type)